MDSASRGPHRSPPGGKEHMECTRISTDAARGAKRIALVRDAASNLFNLEADLDGSPPERVHADIRVSRTPLASVVDVHTSWSVVRRTAARASASPTDHLLLYRIGQGGSWFRNEKGEQFLTRTGSVVVGSQASPYTAAAAAGCDWRFQAVRIAADKLPASGDRIRRRGFSALRVESPLSLLTDQFLASFAQRLDELDAAGMDAAIQALDVLLAANLGDVHATANDDGRALHAARLVAARSFIERCMDNPRLGPELVAAHVGVSPRQVHRLFALEGTSVSLEVRRLRVSRAQALLARDAARPVTDIAFACGFDSLATFYRCFRAVTGMTSTEWREQAVT
jgi:AraC-like DNA-binding protein